MSSLSLLGLLLPLYSPFLSLGRLCQRSPCTFPVSLLCVGSTRRRATALVGQVRPSGQPQTGGGEPPPPPTAGFGPHDVHLRGHFPDCGKHTYAGPFLRSVLLVAAHHVPPPPPLVCGVCIVFPFPCVAWVPSDALGGGWHSVIGGGGGLAPRNLCTKNGPTRNSQRQILLFPTMIALARRGGPGLGGYPRPSYGVRPF